MSSQPTVLNWLSADGLKLFARDYGADGSPSGPPVICIHGLSRNSLDFDDVARRLSERGLRTVAIDVRGRGRSDWDPNPGNYTPAVYAADVLALMQAAGIARASFIGTSMGGLVAMVLAAMRPEAIAAIVLNDVGPSWRTEGMAQIASGLLQERRPATWRAAAAQVRAGNAHVFPDYGEQDWDRMARRLYSPDERGELVRDVDPAIVAGLATAADAPQPDLWPLFMQAVTGRPVLLVRGALSELIDEAIAARMRNAAPHMAYSLIPRVGHAPMLDEPAAIASIDAFLGAIV